MEPLQLILIQLFFIFILARIIAEVFEIVKLPSVVGELTAGILIGNIVIGGDTIEELAYLTKHESEVVLEVLAELGVIFLLFIIGLETRLSDLKRVGSSAMMVGILGVVLPFSFGALLMYSLDGNAIEAAFIGTALVATSIGITAKVLRDMKVSNTKEAKIIMGAAVIDDIFGMVVLAIVSGMAHGSTHLIDLAVTITLAVVFVFITMYIGGKVIRRLAGVHSIYGVKVKEDDKDVLQRMKHPNSPFILALILCLALSAMAQYLGLAAIIGAFLAGMAFAEVREFYPLSEKMESIHDFLIPFFFVYIGMKVDLAVLKQPDILGLIIVLTVLAIIGKMVGGYLGAKRHGKDSAMIIGIGMVPRGEVGIIVAQVGFSLAIIGQDLFSAVILIAVITTLIAPPWLVWGFRRKEQNEQREKVRRKESEEEEKGDEVKLGKTE